MSRIHRRSFIKQLALGTEKALAREPNTLVCIFLRGGADTLNMFVPYGDAEYYSQRPTISIPPPLKPRGSIEASIRLNDFYSVHPRLKPIVPIFESGRLAIIQAVGSDNPTGSHFETQDQIEHGESYGKSLSGGWIGRHLRAQCRRESTPLSAVSLGTSVCEALRGAPSVSALMSINDIQLHAVSGESQAIADTLSMMYGAEVGLLSQPGQDTLRLLKKVQLLHGVPYIPQHGANYASDPLASGLKEIARLIKANVGMQVACIDYGGWDTHFFQGASDGLQAANIEQLGKALAAFDADLTNYQKRVTTLVMTEFGRRTYENGSLGTDHGQGFAMMVIGGSVRGGKVYGTWTGISDQETDVLGPSGLRVKYDYRSVLAEVLSGTLGNKDIQKVFPGFQPAPIGFAPTVQLL